MAGRQTSGTQIAVGQTTTAASEAVAADKSAPNMSATYDTTDMPTAESTAYVAASESAATTTMPSGQGIRCNRHHST
jgi:hypothetical protein